MSVSSRQINLSWKDNATDETNYYVERSPNGSSSWTVIAILGANVTSHQNIVLTQDTRYYYRVRCVAGSTYSGYSNTANAKTAPVAVPTTLTATAASASQIDLSWTDNTTYETNYSVERSPNGSSSWTVIATLGARVTAYSNTGLTAGTDYYYRVQAYDGINYSAYSNVVTQAIRTIAASAGANGAISPSGMVAVASGSSKTFTGNHSISEAFSANMFRIRASAGANGTISPNGVVSMTGGASQTFILTSSTGYHVNNVFVDGALVGAVTAYTFSNVTSNHTISANFAMNSYTITASAGANGTITPSGIVNISSGAPTTFTITPTTGYHVVDVLVDGVSKGAMTSYPFTDVTANHTIIASFAMDTYTITASAGANGTITPSGVVGVKSGATKIIAVTPNTGYHVSDVLVDGVSKGAITSYPFTDVTSNHTIAASFAMDTYTITASAGANGTITPSGIVGVKSGATTTFTVAPNTGYKIAMVAVDGVANATKATYSFSNITANHTISATFSVNTFTISASAGANGSISPLGIVSVNSGTTTTFTIASTTGYHVADVFVDGVSKGAITSYPFTDVTSNHAIAASFAINTYTITASAGANGTITPSGIVGVKSGATTTFTVAPNPGYKIAMVAVDGSAVATNATYSFSNITANHTISATFSVNTSTILASAGANGSISPLGIVGVKSGATTTLTMAPNTGYLASDTLGDGTMQNRNGPENPLTAVNMLVINNGAASTNDMLVTLALRALNATSSVAFMRFSNDGTTWSMPEPYAATRKWMLGSRNGPKTVYAMFQDRAGNWSEAYSASIVLNAGPTLVRILSPIAGFTKSKTPVLNFTINKGDVTHIVKVDGLVINNASGDKLDVLADGIHVLRVEAVDADGLTDFAEVTFTVDATPLIVIITSPIPGFTDSNIPSLIYTLNKVVAWTTVKVDGALVNKISGNTLDALSNGPHTVRIDAMDAVGNIGFAEVAFTVNTALFTVSINPVISPTHVNSQIITGTKANNALVAVTVDTTAIPSPVTYPTPTTWSCTIAGLAEGANDITVMATDAGGKKSLTSASITLSNLSISNIGASSNLINTYNSDSSTIFFVINRDATVNLKVIPERQGPSGIPVYRASQACSKAGAYLFIWDGKDTAGKTVPDEAYLYILEAVDETKTDFYSPSAPTGTGSINCTLGASYDPNRDDPLTINYDISKPARIDLSINASGRVFKVMDAVPHAPGNYVLDWNGRRPDGAILTGEATAQCTVHSLLRENVIITTGNNPKVTPFKDRSR